MSTGTLNDTFEADLLATAVHELGHEMCALEYGLEPRVFIVAAGSGICCHRDPKSLRKIAVVSISGILAEDAFAKRHIARKHPNVPLPLTSADLFTWYDVVDRNQDLLSPEDKNGWVLFPEFQTVQMAFGILQSCADAINFLAPKAAAKARERALRLRGNFRGQEQMIAAFASGQMLDWLDDEKARP